MQDAQTWARLASFRVSGVYNERFIAELCRELRLSPAQAEQAYGEYLRLIYLMQVSGLPLSPPPLLDRVWRLHLGHTRSYWIDLCQNLLRRPLHRNPVPITAETGASHTPPLAQLYLEEFGTPPPPAVWAPPTLWAQLRAIPHLREFLFGYALLLLVIALFERL